MYIRRLVGTTTFAILGLVTDSLQAAVHDLSLTSTASFGSGYLYRGIVRTDGPTFQFGGVGEIGGWRGRVWGNRPFRSAEPSEVQSSLGYLWGPEDELQVELRGTHFWYVHHPIRGTASHSFETNLIVDWHQQDGWDVGLMLLGDLGFQSTGGEIWIGRAVALTHWGTFLHWRAFAGAVDGRRVSVGEGLPAIQDSYTYWGAGIRLPYRITARTSVFAEANVVESIGLNPAWSPLRYGDGLRLWFRSGMEYEF